MQRSSRMAWRWEPFEAGSEFAEVRCFLPGFRSGGQGQDLIGCVPAPDEGCGEGEPAADVVDSEAYERVPRGFVGAGEDGFEVVHVVYCVAGDLVVKPAQALEPAALTGAAPDGFEAVVEGPDLAGCAPEQALEEFVEELFRVLVRVPPEFGGQPDLGAEAGPVGVGFGIEAFDARAVLEFDVVGQEAGEVTGEHPAQAIVVVFADVVALFEPGEDEFPVFVPVFRVEVLGGVLGEVDGGVRL